MNNFLGQSAIEYLMTYGWMLLVVAVVGGAIFSITGDQVIESTSGFSGGDVAVENFGLSSDSLDFILRNSAAEEITVNSVEVTDPETGLTNKVNLQEEIAVSETDTVEVPGIEQGDSSKSLDIEVNYDAGKLSNLTVSGTVSGSLEVYNRLSLEEASFNRSTDQLNIDVKNTGQDSTNSISYTIKANNTDYTGTLNNLDSSETTQINISTDKTYPLESVNLDVEGPQFTDSNSGLQCTPTEGLVGYWPFNEEQTKNGWTKDISGQQNNGSIDSSLEYVDSPTGRAVDGGGSTIYVNNSNSIKSAFSGTEYAISVYWNQHTQDKEWTDIIDYHDSGGTNKRLERGDSDRYSSSDYWVNIGNGNGKYPKNSNPNTDVNGGEWFHIVSQRSTDEVSTWINSEKDQNFSVSEPINEISTDLRMISGDSESFIDEVRIYNRSLSQGEIQRLHNVRNKKWAIESCKLAK